MNRAAARGEQAGLGELGLAWCEARAEADSTNVEALRRAREGAAVPGLVLAASQRAGRGSRGRSWSSPVGGLWMTLLLEAPPAHLLPWLALAAGAAAAEAISTCTGAPVGVKWPNDLVLAGRKLGGILVEAAAGRAAVGLGVNVNNDPPPGIEAISLRPALGREVAVSDLAVACARGIMAGHARLLAGDTAAVAAAWRRHDVLCGRQVVLETRNGEQEITCLGMTGSGSLQYRRADGSLGEMRATSRSRLRLLPPG